MGKRKGIFITFEGGEGSGKTTHSKRIAEYLRKEGFSVVHTREPGGTRIGKLLRGILLHPDNLDLLPETELFLYAAERRQHTEELIRPALKEGKVVISDRFLDATTAYQGQGRRLNKKLVQTLNEMATSGLKPDLTILLDLDPKVGLKRAIRGQGDRLEQEDLSFHRRVREGYLKIARREPQRVKLVKVREGIEETGEIVKKYITQCLPRRQRNDPE